jgi:hypothetical protein
VDHLVVADVDASVVVAVALDPELGPGLERLGLVLVLARPQGLLTVLEGGTAQLRPGRHGLGVVFGT